MGIFFSWRLRTRLRSTRIGVLAFCWICAAGAASTAQTAQPPAQKPGRTVQAKTHPKKQVKPNSKTHARAQAKSHARAARGHKDLARLRRLHQAFVASTELRPMAQQLHTLHTPEAYAGVTRYAHTHSGDAAEAAYLALGNAYLQDQRYADAVTALQQARKTGNVLADYTTYLQAKADLAQQLYAEAENLLTNFGTQHPESILTGKAELLLAQVYVADGDPQSALHQLAAMQGSERTSSTYLYTEAQAQQMAGHVEAAERLYGEIYTGYAASPEAAQISTQIHMLELRHPFTVEQRVLNAKGLAAAGQYSAASAQYNALANSPALAGSPQVNWFLAKAAYYEFRQEHHVDTTHLALLSDTNDEAGALRLYLMLESARDQNNAQQVQSLLGQMQQRFPQSRWTRKALFSAGNMALVTNDLPTAAQDYSALVNEFPTSAQAAASHWHAAWIAYRLGKTSDAARMFEEQVARYAGQPQVAAAIYWRGRIYQDAEKQDAEKNDAAAAACYNTLIEKFHHYYYADLARARLAQMQNVPPVAPLAWLSHITGPKPPALTTEVPSDDEHVLRARLLANAALNQYIAPEIQASPDSAAWAAYAEAQIYTSYGETIRSLHALKRTVHSYFAVPIAQIPRAYWLLLFPRPYWPVLTRDAQRNALDPYLVVSLIRQESEFDPSAVSYANAFGLMQLLPRVGRDLGRKAHMGRVTANDLLNPQINLRLGTMYLRQFMDEFNNQPEYALAAYNAGDDRVKSWQANGPYTDMPEFVESIPFTQTREYVQAILRNVEIYRRLYEQPATAAPATDAPATGAAEKAQPAATAAAAPPRSAR
jgi:soluble lytic murein transglycosylase